MRRSTRGTTVVAAVALVAAGLSAPAYAGPPAPPPVTGTAAKYVQPDVPRSLDAGLLPATGDKRFRRVKAPAKDKAGRTFVYVLGKTAAAAKAAVADVGGKVTVAQGNRVRAAVPGSALVKLAGRPGVAQVKQPDKAFPLAVTSEGVEASGAGDWIRAGKTGAGVKVGVIDVGFDGLSDARAAGEIPAGAVLHDTNCPTENVSPHGTAVAEVVHDMAPGAALFLACAPDAMTFAAAVDWLTQQGVQVIDASIGFTNAGRGDGNGPADSPADVVRRSRQQGVLWVAAAGNQAQLHWTGPATDSDADGYVQVNGTAEGDGFTVGGGGSATVSLKWDAWPTTRKDLDLVVMGTNRAPTGPSDTAIVAQSTNDQAGAAQPLPPTEQVTIDNPSGGAQTYWIYMGAHASYADTRVDLFVTGDATSLSYAVAAGSVLEPASSPYAMAVGASQLGSGRVDDYSSQGPTIDGRTKPDIVGQSGVSTLTFGAAPTFAGTSTGAAHVAGAAALLKGANNDLTAGQIEALLDDRTAPAKFDNQWGHGLLALGTPDTPQAPAANGYTPLQLPRRLLDTSSTIGGHNAPLTAGEQFTVPVSGIPSDATAVAVGTTAWSTNKTHVDLYRDLDSYTGVSTVELAPNDKRSTMAIVPLSAARTITIRNADGTANANIDLLGYFSPTGSGTYTPKDAPQRILDTQTALGGHRAPLAANETYALPVRGAGGVPDTATAVLLDVGVTEATAATFLGVFPQTQPDPFGSLETDIGGIRNTLVLTGIGDDGAVRIRNRFGTAQVTADVVGWFAAGAGAKYVPLDRAAKVLDTRTGTGAAPGPVAQGGVATLALSDVAGVPHDVTAPVLAVSAGGDGASSLSLGPAERGWSGLADLSGLEPGQTVAGLSIPRSGGSGEVKIRNEAGRTDVVAAVTGYFTGGTALAPQTGSCAIDAESGFTPLYDGRSPLSAQWRIIGTGSTTDQNCELTTSANDVVRWYATEHFPADYSLRLDWKASSDTADSGVMLGFSEPVTDPNGPGTTGVEVQIKPNGATTMATGAIASLRAPVAQAQKPVGQWNSYDIRVNGKRVTVTLNDVVVNDYIVPSATRLLDPSFIGLQGSPAAAPVTFRNIRVRVNKPAARYGAIVGSGGQCIDVVGAVKAAATPLQAIGCKGNDAQQFTLPGDGTLRVYGYCVDSRGAARSSTTNFVALASCDGTANQQFTPRPDGSWYKTDTGLCLDDPVTGTNQLYTGPCNGGVNQQWAAPTTQARFGPLIGYQNMCADVYNGATAAGTQLQLIACKGNSAQQYTWPGDGTIRIYGSCIDANGPVRSGTYKYLQLEPCDGGATQQWHRRLDGTIESGYTGNCIDNPTTGTLRLYTYSCTASANQFWAVPALAPTGSLVADPDATLVASWSADENSGSTLADGTGNGRPVKLQPTAAWTPGHHGTAIQLNGTNAYGEATESALQTDRSYSVSAWVRLSTLTGYPSAVSQDGTDHSAFFLRASSNPSQWEFAVSTSPTTGALTRIGSGAGSLVVNRWTHLVGVYDSANDQARLYVDGQLKSSVQVPKLWHATGVTTLGRDRWNSVSEAFWPGAIDEVRLYQGVLTPDQITGLSRS